MLFGTCFATDRILSLFRRELQSDSGEPACAVFDGISREVRTVDSQLDNGCNRNPLQRSQAAACGFGRGPRGHRRHRGCDAASRRLDVSRTGQFGRPDVIIRTKY